MKKKLIGGLNGLGIVLVVITVLIYMEKFSKENLEIVRIVIMSFYVYVALVVPWVYKAHKRVKVISILAMFVYPIGLFRVEWSYYTAAVVFYSVYLFIAHNFLEEDPPLGIEAE